MNNTSPCHSYSSLFTATGGEICNGHGQCINNTCVCDDWWTGGADFFSLDGVGCHNPIVLDRLMWAIAAASWISLWVSSYTTVRHQYMRWHTAKPTDSLLSFTTLRNSPHLYIIMPLFFVVLPILIACFIIRAATSEHFAVDAIVSYMYAIGMTVQWILAMMAQHLMLAGMLTGAMNVRGVELERILASDRRRITIAVLLYSSSLAGTCIAGVYVPVGITAARITITALRNLCMIIWFTFCFLHTSQIHRELQSTMQSHMDAQRAGELAMASSPKMVPVPVSSHSSEPSPLKLALEHLDKTVQTQRIIVLVVVPLLMIFTVVPQLYAYSYIVFGFLLALSAGRNHTLRAWAPNRQPASSRHDNSKKDAKEGKISSLTSPSAYQKVQQHSTAIVSGGTVVDKNSFSES